MQFNNDKEKILIIDFGSQVTKLIGRRIRDLGVYSEIINPKTIKKFKILKNIKGIIFSGGPSTVTKKNFKLFLKKYFKKNPNAWYLLWLTINCKIMWWKDKILKKKREFGRAFLFKKKNLY